jgi:L-aspartate oxidase
MPRPLLSEALRGEGAVLRDEHGVAFMTDEHPMADLAPRDIVARAIARRLVDRGLDHLWLDATAIPNFDRRFPTIFRAVSSIGLDPEKDWLPCAPAAHYVSGGVCTDLDGATTLPGLWACGEAANSGVHGANRLASNSLLDGLVFGSRIVDAIERGKEAPDETGVLRGVPSRSKQTAPVPDADQASLPRTADVTSATREALQQVMTRYAGVLRDANSLHGALKALVTMDPKGEEDRNLRDVSLALVRAALARTESRGTHTRLDHPETSAALLGRFVFLGPGEPVFAPMHEVAATR